MATKKAAIFSKALYDSHIVDIRVPWHIDSLLHVLHCCWYNSTGFSRARTMPLHTRNACATSRFKFLQSLRSVSIDIYRTTMALRMEMETSICFTNLMKTKNICPCKHSITNFLFASIK
jgi:hypothetical protein